MSGIVGIVNLDGRPVDPELLERMTASLDFRGPDAHEVWTCGAVGFGHTLLRTTYEAEHERQPFSLDGQTFIVADCRVDAREELVGKLRAKGRAAAALDRPDVELILHAWHVWGEACVEHLLGDFAFAIWDAPNRRLFCARDHMGVKPFYYSSHEKRFIFSNSIDSIRSHSDFRDTINELFIGDFLLFDASKTPSATAFSDISRLNAGSTCVVANSEPRVSKYWDVWADDLLYRRNATEYEEEMRALVGLAVKDRMRQARIGVLMSGGLDSTVLASEASRVGRERDGRQTTVTAFTSVYDRLVPHEERHYASIAAAHFGVPIQFDVRDDEISIADWDRVAIRTPEPVGNPMATAASWRFFERCATTARVFFYGEGPDDALLYDWRRHTRHLAASGRWVRLAIDIIQHSVAHRRVPLLPTIPAMLAEAHGQRTPDRAFPSWIEPSFAARTSLHERWRSQSRSPELPAHPRARSLQAFKSPLWQALFDGLDADAPRHGLEVRHPFIDMRVLRFLLRLPAMPWCRRKHIIREAFRPQLPPEIVNRRKQSSKQSPDFQRIRQMGLPGLPNLHGGCEYVSMNEVTPPRNAVEMRSVLRGLGLSYWMKNSAPRAAD